MTNLPSRERAAELAADERVYVTDMGSIPPNAPQHVRDAVMADAAWAADKFAILSAYAAGRLVPVERVAEMRERAAQWMDGNAAERERLAKVYAAQGDDETARYMRADAAIIRFCATRIRDLPLDAPAAGGDEGRSQ